MESPPSWITKAQIDDALTAALDIGKAGNMVHSLRSTAEGRQTLRNLGIVDKHSLDSSSYPFIAWDGEGINLRGPKKAQSYCLFGASTGEYTKSIRGLQTSDCFRKMLEVRYKHPHAIHVGFSFGYDVEMMFVGLPYRVIRALHRGKNRYWHGFKITYHHRKYLRVSGKYKGKWVTCTIQDVFTFFGCSFVKALGVFLPDLPRDVFERIRDGKKHRGDFTVAELQTTILPYWQEELQALVKLMTKLRELLWKADLHPKKWHGPAVLATYQNRKHGTAKHMTRETPEYVLNAAQYAYAAGRVEHFLVGRLGKRAYKYDRRSAYPSAMVFLPSLADSKWRRIRYDNNFHNEHDYRNYGMRDFGLYHVDYESNLRHGDLGLLVPHPFFHRVKEGAITFPRRTRRWAWGVEVMHALRENKWSNDRPTIHVSAGIELENYDVQYPFEDWVPEMFERRMQMKRDEQEEQIALKLALNSLYGKMAEKRAWTLESCGEHGWDRKSGWSIGDAGCADCMALSPPIPQWHQLEWAGYVTADNRANMYYPAVLAAQRGILIAIETDAIFTSESMDEFLPQSEVLGAWDKEVFDDIIYLQSGMYLTLNNGKWKFHYRGIDRTSLSDGVDDETTENRAAENVIKYLESTSLNVRGPENYYLQPLIAETTRFWGSKLALRQNRMRSHWRRFITTPKEISVGLSQKRFHHPDYCRACAKGIYFGDQAMHDMVLAELRWRNDPAQDDNIDSYAAKLPWRKLEHEALNWRQNDYADILGFDDAFDEIGLDYE